MAVAAATTTTAAAGGPGDDADDFSRVCNVVASGASEAELRRVIEECAQGDDRRRVQAVNYSSIATETLLQAADRQKRGDLVGALVEAGADVGGIFNGKLTPLAVCIAYGQVESVRALLRAGHDAMEQVGWGVGSGSETHTCSPAHFCLAPPTLGLPSDRVVNTHTRIGAPQIGCLKLVLREGSAEDVDAQDSYGNAPILWLARLSSSYDDEEEKAARDLLVSAGARTLGVFGNKGCSPLIMAAVYNNIRLARFLVEEAGAPVDERSPSDGRTALHWSRDDELRTLLLDAGAAVEARAYVGETPLLWCVRQNDLEKARLLLDRGASVHVIAGNGSTPLIEACDGYNWLRDEGWPLFQEILRRSSAKTRRSCRRDNWLRKKKSALDLLAGQLDQTGPPPEGEDLRALERRRRATAELLASGTPARPVNAAPVLPIAASLSARQEAELAARRAELFSWRAHETFVGLSLDVKELREAEREAEERRTRLAALEREPR